MVISHSSKRGDTMNFASKKVPGTVIKLPSDFTSADCLLAMPDAKCSGKIAMITCTFNDSSLSATQVIFPNGFTCSISKEVLDRSVVVSTASNMAMKGFHALVRGLAEFDRNQNVEVGDIVYWSEDDRWSHVVLVKEEGLGFLGFMFDPDDSSYLPRALFVTRPAIRQVLGHSDELVQRYAEWDAAWHKIWDKEEVEPVEDSADNAPDMAPYTDENSLFNLV